MAKKIGGWIALLLAAGLIASAVLLQFIGYEQTMALVMWGAPCLFPLLGLACVAVGGFTLITAHTKATDYRSVQGAGSAVARAFGAGMMFLGLGLFLLAYAFGGGK